MPSVVPRGLRVQFGLEVVVGVKTAAVVPIVLHEAEVDRHLAHRAGHALSPPLCGGSADDLPSARDPRGRYARLSAVMTIFSAVVRLLGDVTRAWVGLRVPPYRRAHVSLRPPRPVRGPHSSLPRPCSQ